MMVLVGATAPAAPPSRKVPNMPAAVETMMSVREIPWHGLGNIVESELTAAEAIVAAGLDWTVSLQPMIQRLASGDHREVEKSFLVVRDSDESVLGKVSDRYTPFQNSEAFDFFDTLVDSDEAKYDTAGSLFDGRIVWLTAKLPTDITVAGLETERIETYVLLHTGHDGSKSITISVTPVRVVCANTLNLATARAKRTWNAVHSAKAAGKVSEARETLGLTFAYVEEFKDLAERLLAVDLELAGFEALATRLLPTQSEKMKDALVDHHASTPTLTDEVRNTGWGAVNSVGEYFQHVRGFKSEDRRMEHDLFSYGNVAKLRDRAVRLLLAR